MSALQNGVQDCLSKPLQAARVLALVDRLLARGQGANEAVPPDRRAVGRMP